ncbi:hypothetical protein [Streptomyces chryseus]
MSEQRMRFVLDGEDRLSRAFNNAGDSADDLNRTVTRTVNDGSTSLRQFARNSDNELGRVRRFLLGTSMAARLLGEDTEEGTTQATQATVNFTRDANGRLRDLNGRFLTAGEAARAMGEDVDSGSRRGILSLLGLRRAAADAGSAGASAAADLGTEGGGLGWALKGIGAAAAMNFLPAIGAIAPMAAGAGLAAVTMKLGFSGVGEAIALASEDAEEYRKVLKKMPPEQRELTESVVNLKKEFKGLGGDVQAAMLPGFTKAVKEADPLVKILGRSATEMGRGLGDAAEGASKLMNDSGFRDDFTEVLSLGNVFVRDLTSGLGGLGLSFLDFGSKSEPTLRSISGGLKDLLGGDGTGLPGMFDGLEQGVDGSSRFLDGFFGMINKGLPAIGRLSGTVSKVTGPAFEQLFDILGSGGAAGMDTVAAGFEAAEPVIKDVGYGLKTVNQLAGIFGPSMRDAGLAVLDAFSPVSAEINKARGPLQRLSGWIEDNKIKLQEGSRVMAGALVDMVGAVVEYTPSVIKGFRLMSTGILTAIDGIVSGAASAFGDLPIIGEQFEQANTSFDKFKDGFISGLHDAEQQTQSFADATLPRLERNKLKLDIASYQRQIQTAKEQMKSVPPEKRSALKATIADLEAKVRAGKERLKSVPDKTARLRGDLADLQSKLADAKGRLSRVPDSRKAKVRADIAALSAAVNSAKRALASVNDKTVTIRTHYVVTGSTARKSGSHGAQLKAAGGLIRGPGTGTSDDVPVWASNNEYMVKAKSVAKYGTGLLDAINNGTFAMSSALGGSSSASSQGAGRATAQGLVDGMGAGTAGVESSARSMAGAILTGIREELQIASPSKKTRALAADAGKGLIIGLTGSKAKISAVAKDLVKDIWAAWKGTKSTKDSQLVRMVDRDTKKLLKLASDRDKIAATIAAAKKFAADVTAGARQDASLSNLGMGEGQEKEVTAGGIKAGLAEKLQKIKTFTSYINILGKRGLNKSLLRQILAMGPEEGYAYASALAGASKDVIKSINSTQSKIDKATTTLGRDGSDRLYDSGKNAGRGFLKGLEGQRKKIEDLMLDIAKGMQKAIKKALGIKSPSTVMAQLGRYSTEGLAVGLTDRMPVLDKALTAVTDRVGSVRPAFGIGPVGLPGRGGAPMHVQIDVKALDAVAAAREIRRMLLELKRTQGVNINLGVA